MPHSLLRPSVVGTIIIDIIEQTLESEAGRGRLDDSSVALTAVKFECIDENDDYQDMMLKMPIGEDSKKIKVKEPKMEAVDDKPVLPKLPKLAKIRKPKAERRPRPPRPPPPPPAVLVVGGGTIPMKRRGRPRRSEIYDGDLTPMELIPCEKCTDLLQVPVPCDTLYNVYCTLPVFGEICVCQQRIITEPFDRTEDLGAL